MLVAHKHPWRGADEDVSDGTARALAPTRVSKVHCNLGRSVFFFSSFLLELPPCILFRSSDEILRLDPTRVYSSQEYNTILSGCPRDASSCSIKLHLSIYQFFEL
jgi:hypothetical protein